MACGMSSAGAIVLTGDATDRMILRQAGIDRAGCLIAVCDDDSVNAEVALQARSITEQLPGCSLTCLSHVVDPGLWDLLRGRMTDLITTSYRLELFNVFDLGARLLLQDYPPYNALTVSAGGNACLMIVGLGRMGENLVVHVAREWWNQTKNLDTFSSQKRPKIFVLDRQANAKIPILLARYPRLAQACELVPLDMNVRSAEFYQAAYLKAFTSADEISAAYVCLDDDALALQTGLLMDRHLPQARVVVRISEGNGLAHLITGREATDSRSTHLYTFELLNRTCTPDLLLSTQYELLARAIHEDFVHQEQTSGHNDPARPATKAWEELDPIYRQENYQRVDRIQLELEIIGCKIVPLIDWEAPSWEFSTQEIDQMAEMEHETWRTEKERHGWHYAPGARDDQSQTHPDLINWDHLPQAEQDKNRSIVQAIPQLLARCGYQVERR